MPLRNAICWSAVEVKTACDVTSFSPNVAEVKAETKDTTLREEEEVEGGWREEGQCSYSYHTSLQCTVVCSRTQIDTTHPHTIHDCCTDPEDTVPFDRTPDLHSPAKRPTTKYKNQETQNNSFLPLPYKRIVVELFRNDNDVIDDDVTRTSNKTYAILEDLLLFVVEEVNTDVCEVEVVRWIGVRKQVRGRAHDVIDAVGVMQA